MCLPLRLYCNNATDCYDGTDEVDCNPSKRVYQVTRIFIDEKNSNSSSLLIEWEMPPAPVGVKIEYMPSYLIIGRPGWHNTTWTDQSEMRLGNLTAFTLYNLTVWVRTGGADRPAYPPSLYVSAQTKMGSPSPPWNVTVKQISHSEVQVRWNAPVRPNGPLNTFRVFVEPTAPSLILSVPATSIDALLTYKYVAGVNYTFRVAAENRYSASNRSGPVYLVFDGSAIIPAVTDLRVLSSDNSSVQLVWSPVGDKNISGYLISIKTSNYYAQHPQLNSTTASINVTGLSPGVRYTFEVSARRLSFNGPPSSVVAITSGEELSGVNDVQANVVKGDMTSVKIEWQPPKDKRKLKWEYGIYYGANLKVSLQSALFSSASA